MKVLVLALLGWVLTCAQARAADPEVGVIRWQVLDIPPAISFAKGRAPRSVNELGRGEVDGFMRLLIEQMPQYRHEFVEAGVARFEALSRQDKAMCSLLLVRTPARMEWLFYSPIYPPQVSRQIHVIVRRDRLPLFSAPQGQVLRLADILQRSDLAGLMQQDRSYGPRIDALLSAQDHPAPRRQVTSRNAQLLDMLRAGRMDYTLEYPFVLKEFQGSADHANAELIPLPIAEGLSTSVAYAACSRNPEGRRAIEAIDLAERQLAQSPRREELLKAWRGEDADEIDRARLRRFMDERARAGSRIE